MQMEPDCFSKSLSISPTSSSKMDDLSLSFLSLSHPSFPLSFFLSFLFIYLSIYLFDLSLSFLSVDHHFFFSFFLSFFLSFLFIYLFLVFPLSFFISFYLWRVEPPFPFSNIFFSLSFFIFSLSLFLFFLFSFLDESLLCPSFFCIPFFWSFLSYFLSFCLSLLTCYSCNHFYFFNVKASSPKQGLWMAGGQSSITHHSIWLCSRFTVW